MALQTTGLEFFYLSVDFFENDKILLVEQELGYIACIAFIGTYLPQRKFCILNEAHLSSIRLQRYKIP